MACSKWSWKLLVLSSGGDMLAVCAMSGLSVALWSCWLLPLLLTVMASRVEAGGEAVISANVGAFLCVGSAVLSSSVEDDSLGAASTYLLSSSVG